MSPAAPLLLLLLAFAGLLASVAAAAADVPPPDATLASAGRSDGAPEAAPADQRRQLLIELLRSFPDPRNERLLAQLAPADFQFGYIAHADHQRGLSTRHAHPDESRAEPANEHQQQHSAASATPNQFLGHYNRTNIIIRAFNYKFNLELELNDNLFGPGLIQKHFLPKGAWQISTHKLDHCYYHAKAAAAAAAQASTNSKPTLIGAFRTCSGLSGIIHSGDESFVIHPFYSSESNKKQPHIIYRYQSLPSASSYPSPIDPSQSNLENGFRSSSAAAAAEQQQQLSPSSTRLNPTWRECGNTRLHEWALRQHNKPIEAQHHLYSQQQQHKFIDRSAASIRNPNKFKRLTSQLEASSSSSSDPPPARGEPAGAPENIIRSKLLTKRDVSLTQKYIELALVLSQDIFDKRNSSTRLEVLHDAIQVINCLDLYYRHSANTRVALVYLETWQHGDQISINYDDVKQTLYDFLDYSTKKLFKVSMDAIHLLTGAAGKQTAAAAAASYNQTIGMAIPDSICTPRAVSLSLEASVFEPFLTASTIAHMLGHNLGMEHDDNPAHTQSWRDQVSYSQQSTGGGGGGLQQPAQVDSRSFYTKTLPALEVTHSGRYSANIRPPLGLRTMPADNQRPHYSSAPDDHEEQETIESRSILLAPTGSKSDGPLAPPYVGRVSESDENADCQSNCLMSERFPYVQPPVFFGSLIQLHSNGSARRSSSDSSDGLAAAAEPSNSFNFNNFHIQQLHSPVVHNHLPHKFSRQSIDKYHKLLRLGHAICLFNKPNRLEDFKTCGNGIVDKGEDCDCGSIQECHENDSCCDPITCKFMADAECINGACCDRCKLRPRGYVCRRAKGECDLPEICDGKSGQCQPDVYKQNGFACAEGQGHCFMGQCPTHELQCLELWGQDARESHQVCYTNYNLNGTIRGNCGYNQQAHRFERCSPMDMMCGTLQCQLGDMKPITASLDGQQPADDRPANGTVNSRLGQPYEFSKKIIHSNDGQNHECKTIITGANSAQTQSTLGHHQQSSSSVGYVRDGTKCGPDRVCHSLTCQPLDQAYKDAYELCPRDALGKFCSGNGICSTANRCHCEPDWTGHDCSQHVTPPPTSTLEAINGITLIPIQPPIPAIELAAAPNSMPAGSLNQYAATAPGQISILGPHLAGLRQLVNHSSGLQTATSTAASGDELTTAPPPPQPQPTEPPVAVTSAPQAQVTTSSATPVIASKEKRDALSAPTLVFILVSIVAAVYVGFALMANCYRRKGLLKPDKVLRHHQMNCKLDALRSSFIARRLAEAETGTFDTSATTIDGATASTGISDRLLGAGNSLLINGSSSMSFKKTPASHYQVMPHNERDSIGGQDYPGSQMQEQQQQQQQHQQQRETPLLAGPGMQLSLARSKCPESQLDAQTQMISRVHATRPTNLHHRLHHHHHHLHHQHQHRHRAQHQQQIPHPHSCRHSIADDSEEDERCANLESCRRIQSARNGSSFAIDSMGDAMHATESGDHIPLLDDNITSSLNHRHQSLIGSPCRLVTGKQFCDVRTLVRRTLNVAPSPISNQRNANELTNTPVGFKQSATLGSNLNRAFSLGNVADNHVDPLGRVALESEGQRTLNNKYSGHSNRDLCHGENEVDDEDYLDDEYADFDVRNFNEDHNLIHHNNQTTPSRRSRPMHRHVSGATLVQNHNRNMAETSNTLRSFGDGRAFGHSLGPRAPSCRRGMSTLELDSCSAPSSPEHRSHWVRYNQRALLVETPHAAHISGQTRFQQPPPLTTTGSRERGLQMSQSESMAASTLRLASTGTTGLIPPPPPPPPPPLPSGIELISNSTRLRDEDDCKSEQHQPPMSSGSIQKNQLSEQLSLIAQLQQLEQVHVMHQKQVATKNTTLHSAQSSGNNHTEGAKGDGANSLHEFFSLPLSIQLSALLARNLASHHKQSEASLPIDDLLNALNNTNVVTSSRRSFKTSLGDGIQSKLAAGDQQSCSSSRGSTINRRQQQIKLQNLQGLIDRLQKLQAQTMTRQHREGVAGTTTTSDTSDDDEDAARSRSLKTDVQPRHPPKRPVAGTPRHPSATSMSEKLAAQRHSVAGLVSGQQNGPLTPTPDDGNGEDKMVASYEMAKSEDWPSGRLQVAAVALNRTEAATSRCSNKKHNESVYSMSDSEDGGEGYASRILIAASHNNKQDLGTFLGSQPKGVQKVDDKITQLSEQQQQQRAAAVVSLENRHEATPSRIESTASTISTNEHSTTN